MNICAEGQPFGENYNGAYAAAGLRGHTGEDWGCGFGTPIKSRYDGIVYKVLTKEQPAADGSGFTGVFMIVDDGVEMFEWLVGHCDPLVTPGQPVKAGDVIGTEANHGTVFAGNVQITLAMQKAGDERGHHRHYQKRPVRQSLIIDRPCLSANSDESGYYKDVFGHFYPIWDYDNGYNGCVDPSVPTFRRDLTLGSRGYDVFCLQRFLAKQGLLTAVPTGFFGSLTMGALAEYQAAHGIVPAGGYFGPTTRGAVEKAILPPAKFDEE